MYDNQYNLEKGSEYNTKAICPCKSNGCTNACTYEGGTCMKSCSNTCAISCSSHCTWMLIQ